MMNIAEAKNISLADYLQSMGITPCKRQGNNLWYYSPFRNEAEVSFKVNLSRNEWYDFGLGKGGDILDFEMERDGINDISQVLCIISGETLNVQPSFFFRQFDGFMDYLLYLSLLHKHPSNIVPARDV